MTPKPNFSVSTGCTGLVPKGQARLPLKISLKASLKKLNPAPTRMSNIGQRAYSRQCFLEACHRGDAAMAIKFSMKLQAGTDHADRTTGLCIASLHGHDRVVSYLGRRTDVTREKNHAIRLACLGGHLEVVCSLQKLGADPRDDNDSALRMASAGGKLEVVKYLVEECSADITAMGQQAVIAAIMARRSDVARYLIRASGSSTVPWACREGRLRLVGLLVSHGADVDYALAFAARHGATYLLRFLYERHPDRTRASVAAAGWAVRHAVAWGHREAARYLLTQGADPNAHSGAPLIIACGRGDIDMVRTLVSHGASIAANGYGALNVARALHERAQAGRLVVIDTAHGSIASFLEAMLMRAAPSEPTFT